MKTSKTIHSKKQKYNAALAMAVLMTLGGFSFGANPVLAEGSTNKAIFIDNSNAEEYKDGIFVSDANTMRDLVYIGTDLQTKKSMLKIQLRRIKQQYCCPRIKK